MNTPEVKKVPFMGDELIAFRDDNGQVWAGVSHICNGLGLTKHQKDRQTRNIQNDRVLKKGCLKFEAGVFDSNNETISLKLDYVPLWLAKIKITPTMERETPELADKLEAYQLKAKDALANAFTANALPPHAAPAQPTMAIVKEMELRFKVMEKMGCSPYEIAGMMTSMDKAYGIAVSKVLADQLDPQLCLFDAPALPADAPLLLS